MPRIVPISSSWSCCDPSTPTTATCCDYACILPILLSRNSSSSFSVSFLLVSFGSFSSSIIISSSTFIGMRIGVCCSASTATTTAGSTCTACTCTACTSSTAPTASAPHTVAPVIVIGIEIPCGSSAHRVLPVVAEAHVHLSTRAHGQQVAPGDALGDQLPPSSSPTAATTTTATNIAVTGAQRRLVIEQFEEQQGVFRDQVFEVGVKHELLVPHGGGSGVDQMHGSRGGRRRGGQRPTAQVVPRLDRHRVDLDHWFHNAHEVCAVGLQFAHAYAHAQALGLRVQSQPRIRLLEPPFAMKRLYSIPHATLQI
mmetsp:Transcript_7946/g.13173  ORF Transcript_7946/g.13173 Transcript_7946/m.13173 type:complete len:312 (+) Transcript_7946:2476-3411(+)